MDKTKVHYANSEVFNPHPLNYKTNEKEGTFPSRRAAFTVDNCRDITIEDIYIATDVWGQAEGILVNGERIAIYRSQLVGTGDAWRNGRCGRLTARARSRVCIPLPPHQRRSEDLGTQLCAFTR